MFPLWKLEAGENMKLELRIRVILEKATETNELHGSLKEKPRTLGNI